MSTRLRWFVVILCLVVNFDATEDARAQADPQNYLFNSGQTVQPFFEGWAHNPDGSFEMHFGYLNRNYVEELQLPIGQDNRMTPDDPDRGQPTFFYPRVNHRVFSVTVPADWGDKELVWQVTVRDETYRAVGWLQPEWEIAANPGARFFAATEGQAAWPDRCDPGVPGRAGGWCGDRHRRLRNTWRLPVPGAGVRRGRDRDGGHRCHRALTSGSCLSNHQPFPTQRAAARRAPTALRMAGPRGCRVAQCPRGR